MNPAFSNLKFTGLQLCPDKHGLLSQLMGDNLIWRGIPPRLSGSGDPRMGKKGEEGKLNFEGHPSNALSMSRSQYVLLPLPSHEPVLKMSSEVS